MLVLNCGSSSVKYRLIDLDTEKSLAEGIVERIGLAGTALIHRPQHKEEVKMEIEISDHRDAVKCIVDTLISLETGVIDDLHSIAAVGHRVAHGGDLFQQATVITREVKGSIKKLASLAPLHNPANLTGIQACEELMPGVTQVAVFDTAFHQTIPPRAYLYAIPYNLYEKYSIRRYGFHGTSHHYVARRVAELFLRPLQELKIITCHLGNGASITAVNNGFSIDTSMGFTPLEGLVMGTRSGDIDPGVITFLLQKESFSVEEINDMLNKESGVAGLSEVSSDFRDLEQAAEQGNPKARLALDVFVYKVKKYIGAYSAALNGLDALVFTGGIGENSPETRAAICDSISYLGIELNNQANNVEGKEGLISSRQSRCQVWVIPTDEELMIARETKRACIFLERNPESAVNRSGPYASGELTAYRNSKGHG